MSKLAIIPARGGSKRIPRKNIRDFLGKPILSYSIEIAQRSGLFDEVMVSTDDPEIAALALQYGASVPFTRSLEASNDHATTFQVIEEVINEYKNRNSSFNYGCCIYPTAPLLKPETLQEGYHLMLSNRYDVVLPVLEFSFPIWRSLVNHPDQPHKVMFQWPENSTKRSQDLPRSFHDAGQFYWLNIPAILQKKMLLTDNIGAVFVNEIDAQDIDNLSDWNLAEFKYKYRNSLQ